MLEQQFKTIAQQSIFEKVAIWAREMYGELAFVAPDAPVISLQIGSAYLAALVVPWGEKEAMINVRSYVVTDITLTPELMYYLLQSNANFAIGAFGIGSDDCVVFEHTIVGSTCDKEELRTSFHAVISVADEEDDFIVSRWGGKRAIDR
jgi:hypothetical protein